MLRRLERTQCPSYNIGLLNVHLIWPNKALRARWKMLQWFHDDISTQHRRKVFMVQKEQNKIFPGEHLDHTSALKPRKKTHFCEECGKRFSKSNHLITHLRTHSVEKPYCCQECGKSFPDSSHLTYHMRTHSGEKPYCCQQCGKRFSQSSNLTTHMRTHFGEKRYCCQECGKSISHANTLMTHMRSHSVEKNILLPAVWKSIFTSEHLDHT